MICFFLLDFKIIYFLFMACATSALAGLLMMLHFVLFSYMLSFINLCRFEGQISSKNIEIGIIGTDRKFRQVLFSFSH